MKFNKYIKIKLNEKKNEHKNYRGYFMRRRKNIRIN